MANLLIESKIDKPIVFVGDLHGDLVPLQNILKYYPPGPNRLIFLGDYIDRGPDSFEVLDTLKAARNKFPEDVILLMGNHDFGSVVGCGGDFWHAAESRKYERFLNTLPIAACVGNDIICTHACLPDLNDVADFNNLQQPKSNIFFFNEIPKPQGRYMVTLWGDIDNYGRKEDSYTVEDIRPVYDAEYIVKILDKIGRKFLFRAHQPGVNTVQEKRIFTIISTKLYNNPLIAVLKKSKDITVKDFVLINPYTMHL